jgi:hypothetical protein
VFTSFWGRDNKTLRQVRGLAATVVAVLLLLLGAGLVAQAAGPTPQWHVVQGSDGTLYLISDTGRHTLQVDPISDDDLAALPDAGPTGPFVGAPPTPSSAAEPENLPPADTSGEPSLVPPPVPEVVSPVAPEAPPSTISSTPPALGALPPSDAVNPATSSGQTGPGPAVPPRSAVPPPLSTSLPLPAQGPGPTSPPTPTPMPTATLAAGAEAPVLISGSGSQTTRTFSLRGGTYNALWTSTTPTSTADTFAAILRPADPGSLHTQVIGTALVPGSRSISGQAQITSLPAGTYSVDIVGGTNWTLSISVQTSPGGGRP